MAYLGPTAVPNGKHKCGTHRQGVFFQSEKGWNQTQTQPRCLLMLDIISVREHHDPLLKLGKRGESLKVLDVFVTHICIYIYIIYAYNTIGTYAYKIVYIRYIYIFYIFIVYVLLLHTFYCSSHYKYIHIPTPPYLHHVCLIFPPATTSSISYRKARRCTSYGR